MKKQLTCLSLLMASACSQEPGVKADQPVAVVAGVIPAKNTTSPMIMQVAVPSTTPDTARAQPKLLSVAESAEVHTAEMWSEPIAPTH